MLFAFKQGEPRNGNAQSDMQPDPETTPVEAKSPPDESLRTVLKVYKLHKGIITQTQ